MKRLSVKRALTISFPLIALFTLGVQHARAQQVNSDLFKSLHWRSIGLYRGGRTRAVAGVPSQPNVVYIAQVNGGGWQTNDYGRTSIRIFDDESTGSNG